MLTAKRANQGQIKQPWITGSWAIRLHILSGHDLEIEIGTIFFKDKPDKSSVGLNLQS